ncbi:LuxR C-terminal-related transcriptional regulator [Streptomyces wedmorensis]
MTGREPGARWPLTSRDGELAAFMKRWAERRCQGVVIYGPAGVGKSRLAEECLARAVHEGFAARRCTASAAAAAVPLGAIAHLIPPGVDLSDPVKGFAAVATALAGPQRDRRWAVWVDDLHLLDATSAVLLRQLIDARVVRLIATVRTSEPVGEAAEALTGSDAMHRLDLSAFDQEQVQRVLEAALGGPVSRRTLHELYTASGGNALYLHELVLGALHTGALTRDGEIWELTGDRPVGTPRLAELIEARLTAADVRARPVLELLALCEPVPLADAQSVAAAGVLATLEEADLVQVTTSRRRTVVQLAHPLYGEALRANMPVLRRRTLLLQQADRTQARGARRRDDVLRIATWQLAATGTADPTLLTRAAALARHAHDYQQAVALLRALPGQYRTTTTQLLLGSALDQQGRSELAEAELAEAYAWTPDEADKLTATFARTVTLAWSAAKTVEALAVIQAASGTVTSPTGQRMLGILEGAVRVVNGQPVQGLAVLGDLTEDIRQAAGVNVWLIGASTKSTALAERGRTAQSILWAERTYSGHLQVSDRTMAPHPAAQRAGLVLALTEAGQLNDARRAGEDAYAALVDVDAPVARIWVAFSLGRAELLAGHPETAHQWYAEAAASARTCRTLSAMRLVLAGLAAATSLRTDTAAARALQVECDSCPRIGLFAGEERLGEAWLLAGLGRLGEARTVLAEAARSARETGHVTSEALLLTDVARLGGAKEVTGRLAELAEVCDGALAPARAHLAAALAADDPDQLMAAASEFEEIGADLLAAEAATQAAAAWQRAGQARKAAAASQQARSCAERCEGARTPMLTAAQTAAVLTAREKEIALLAAAGTASKDIADTLHLSVRTVDNHLQHAYAKLGVTTRAELAHTLGTATTRPMNPSASAR